MLGAAPWLGRFCLRWPGLVVFAVVIALSALLSTLVGPSHHAQSQDEPTNTDEWVDQGGNVKANVSTLTINEGETKSYSVRLTKQPHMNADDDWWVMIVADGERRGDVQYKGVSWIPSIGRTFDRNDWSQWKDIRITAHEDDNKVDVEIIFRHELWDHDAYCPPGLHGSGQHIAKVIVRIVDSDGNLPGLSIEDATVEEGGKARFRVTLSKLTEQSVTVGYQTQNDTANAGTNPNAGADYVSKSGTLTFSAGTSEQFVEVQTHEDDLDEPNEVFTVTLSNPDGAALSKGTGTGTIIDGDVPPELSIGDAGADEGDVATFNVTLTQASGKTVTVDYATADGTAEAPMDYAATSGTLTFLAGEQSKPISVPIQDDAIDEPVETFTVTLRNPTDATLDDGTATGTITDGDNPPELSIEDAPVGEGDPAQFTVTLTPASGKTVTVDYATADGTAEAPADYTSSVPFVKFVQLGRVGDSGER